MKPQWDKLMAQFAESTTALVADVDCTASGAELCKDAGIEGYPSIKHGHPAEVGIKGLETYKGPRDFDSLRKFAEENLGPTCGPDRLDLCDDAQKELIAKWMEMSKERLEALIRKKKDTMETMETEHRAFTTKVQKEYEDANTKQKKDIAAAKKSGVGMMKAVAAFREL